MTRRSADVNLDILPWGKIIPFFGYTHSSGFGRGVTLYIPRSNEYPVPTDLDDSMHQYRSGVRVETTRFHFTIEQGAFQFDDNQRVYETQTNSGNRTTPLAGQNLVLRQLQAQYGISGDAYFSRASVTANPTSWLDLFGNWMYAQPKIDAR